MHVEQRPIFGERRHGVLVLGMQEDVLIGILYGVRVNDLG